MSSNPFIWEENVKIYDHLVSLHPDITRKGKANPYTSVNGHMFSFINKEGQLGIRLSKEDRLAFLEKYNTDLIISYNTVMKEYVRIPDDMMGETEFLLETLDKSFQYVKSLKPKPTKK